jgi:hypothetical protein
MGGSLAHQLRREKCAEVVAVAKIKLEVGPSAETDPLGEPDYGCSIHPHPTRNIARSGKRRYARVRGYEPRYLLAPRCEVTRRS